ncbi:hypothetical protein ACIA8E_27460 [Streptomyces sp. NPDC051664]|uniref:hypothetical protein n=1 Tax=Streptomyces sp. NPDC051664 TaxID=3365668 RepID=UPI0037A4AF81
MTFTAAVAAGLLATTLLFTPPADALISQVPMFPMISHEAAEWADGSIYDAHLDYRSNMYVDYIRVWQ